MTTRVAHVRDGVDGVYIGRPGHGLGGPFGNPIIAGKKCQVCSVMHWGKPQILACFEVYLRARLRHDDAFKKSVADLRGKTLLCFCFPDRCHGDILAAVTEELHEERSHDPDR